ncbi:ribonuclease H-like domain-containing protein [Truncatella angustata]|uniref:ribonuclease H n=1 Tax=Truncatella angustata TaxID=152316 RepID=A0A9P8UCQ1_9PEZI|nr:ribonuclease H-like domain-containing protein [Truncatella angustata]KAH6646102.1 ribonuclease H-like domain-containing protein [Truncatella angustata]
MPLGWYLAQGMVPLGPSSSDDEEGPCTLPNGRLVCGPHGLVTCGRCCTDYSFMDDVLSEEDEHGRVDDDDDDDDDDEVVDSDTEAMYRELSPSARAEIDARWGPHSLHRSNNEEEAAAVRLPWPMVLGPIYVTRNGIPLDFGLEMRRGTGRVFPTKFFPPSSSIRPTELFTSRTLQPSQLAKWTHRSDPHKVLIFTDGACLNNGQPNPKAGWAFVDGPGRGIGAGTRSGRLETKGPFGDDGIQSSNRAELRAVIAALRFRDWDVEGYYTIIIATDSAYVVQGCCKWVKTWIRHGWKTNARADVKNRDLWEMLLGEVERWHDKDVAIQFWKIPREWNDVADAAAKRAAADEYLRDKWTDLMGGRI